MQTSIYIIILVVALAIALAIFITLYIIQRGKIAQLASQISLSEQELQATNSSLQAEVSAHQATRNALQEEKIARIKVATELEAERRSIDDKVRSQQEMEKSLREQFRNLAGDVLGEQSRRFKQENQESIDIILKPFKDNIREFKERVESIYSHQTEQSGELKNELKRLMELNVQITTETTNLTNALKGNSKVQGDWGEMILETLLENAGLERGINFETQLTRDSGGNVLKNDEGKLLRPDVLIKLPDNHSIIVDSKVSLTSFVDYCNAEDENVRIVAGKKHLQSVYAHIDELYAKMYQNNLKGAADYVMMFIPNESAYIAAVQLDINLWKYAYERGVIIVSPTHLFSVMSIVSQLWRQDKQNRNAMLIAERGGKLYDKLVLFMDSFEKVGKSIDDAMTSYNKSFNQLRTGKGNVLRQAEDMKALGAKASKSLPERLSDSSE